MRPQSVLWIGSADRMQASAVASAAEIDLVWAREPREALGLPLASFACVVMDASAGGPGSADELRRAGAAEVLVTRDPALYTRLADLARAPARSSGPPCGVVGTSEAMQRTLALSWSTASAAS